MEEMPDLNVTWNQAQINRFVLAGGLTTLFAQLRKTFQSKNDPKASGTFRAKKAVWYRSCTVLAISHLAHKSTKVMQLLEVGPLGGVADLMQLAAAYCPPQNCEEDELTLVRRANSAIFELLFALMHRPNMNEVTAASNYSLCLSLSHCLSTLLCRCHCFAVSLSLYFCLCVYQNTRPPHVLLPNNQP